MWDSLIIGSGPAGLGAAIYGKRAGLSVLVAEKEYMGTGQIAESGQVDNYLGLVGKSGYDLGEIFLEDAKKLGAEFYEGEAVAFEKKENSWSVSFENGEVVEAKTVIYGAGAKHRPLGLPEEADYAGKGISYCAICDGAFYKGKNGSCCRRRRYRIRRCTVSVRYLYTGLSGSQTGRIPRFCKNLTENP